MNSLKIRSNINNHKILLNSFLFLLLLFSIFTVSTASAGVVFEDNFDSRPDWSSSTTTSVAETWPGTMQTVLGGPTTTSSPPAWYSYRSAAISHTTGAPLYVVDNEDPYDGTGKSLRYNLENRSYMNGGGLDLVLCNSTTCGYDEIYFSFYMKLEANFDFPDGGSDFIKLARFYSGVDVVNDNLSPSSTYANTTDQDNGIKRSMNAYLDIVTDGNNDYRIRNSYFLGQHNGGDYVEQIAVAPESAFNFKDHLGEWLYVQQRVKMNTLGSSNGLMQTWVIPVSGIGSYDLASPTFEWTGLEIRSDSNRHFNTIIFADNMSGQWERSVSEQTIYFDNIVVSTTPVQPKSNSSIVIEKITLE